jgi:hypothetical protein
LLKHESHIPETTTNACGPVPSARGSFPIPKCDRSCDPNRALLPRGVGPSSRTPPSASSKTAANAMPSRRRPQHSTSPSSQGNAYDRPGPVRVFPFLNQLDGAPRKLARAEGDPVCIWPVRLPIGQRPLNDIGDPCGAHSVPGRDPRFHAGAFSLSSGASDAIWRPSPFQRGIPLANSGCALTGSRLADAGGAAVDPDGTQSWPSPLNADRLGGAPEKPPGSGGCVVCMVQAGDEAQARHVAGPPLRRCGVGQ